jgi:hypothetical protein
MAQYSAPYPFDYELRIKNFRNGRTTTSPLLVQDPYPKDGETGEWHQVYRLSAPWFIRGGPDNRLRNDLAFEFQVSLTPENLHKDVADERTAAFGGFCFDHTKVEITDPR